MKEMRQTKRVIPAHQPKGKLVLLVKEQRFDVTSVRDIHHLALVSILNVV